MALTPGAVVLRSHRPDIVDEWVKTCQPSLIVLRTETASGDVAAAYRSMSPNSIIMPMDGAMADSLGYSDSILTWDLKAQARGATDRFARMREEGYGSGPYKWLNEPAWWNYEIRKRLIELYTVWKPMMHAEGLSTADLHISNGWPWVNHYDTENWWPEFQPVFEVTKPGDYWVLHEYIKPSGMGFSEVPWRAYKHKLCPYPVDILIGEFAVHGGIETDASHFDSGWQMFMNAEQYLEIIKQYMSNLDNRVKGVALFAMDFQDREWQRFDLVTLAEKGYLRSEVFQGLPPAYAAPKLRWPTAEPVRITQYYGENPSYYRQFGVAGHTGIDLGQPTVQANTPIYAAHDGQVYRMRQDSAGYGNHLYLNGGGVATLYAHLERFVAGIQQEVKAGDIIGFMGNTGNSTGKHLHFAVLEPGKFNKPMNDWLDPMPYLKGAVPPTPPSPPPTDDTMQKARWYTEEATRRAESAVEAVQDIHRMLVDEVTPRLYKMENE